MLNIFKHRKLQNYQKNYNIGIFIKESYINFEFLNLYFLSLELLVNFLNFLYKRLYRAVNISKFY